MMNIIPVAPSTLDLIQTLNDGVRPTLEDEPTFFVFRGQDGPSSIITKEELDGDEYPEYFAMIEIAYIGD